MFYDLAIIGGGPAGAAAAVYAARKRLKTVFITEEWGGQSTVSTEIQNWIGTPVISGTELAANLRKHVESYAGESLSIVSPARATSLAPQVGDPRSRRIRPKRAHLLRVVRRAAFRGQGCRSDRRRQRRLRDGRSASRVLQDRNDL